MSQKLRTGHAYVLSGGELVLTVALAVTAHQHTISIVGVLVVVDGMWIWLVTWCGWAAGVG